MAAPLIIDVATPAATDAFGHRLGKLLFPGAVVGLVGPLGAGKTHLVRAIAEGLEIAGPFQVSSPTFVLIQEYEGRLPIYHFDAFRLSRERDFADLGAHEYFEGSGVSLVEWADRVSSFMPPEHLQIKLVVTGAESRRLELTAQGARYQEVLEKLRG